MKSVSFFAAFALFSLICADTFAQGANEAGTTDQLIIKYKSSSGPVIAGVEKESDSLSRTAGVQIQQGHARGNGVYVLHLPSKMPAQQVNAIVGRLAQRSDVLYVQPDYIVHSTALSPDDDFYVNQKQWSLGGAPGGMDVFGAWQQSAGLGNQVVAVVDTGVLPGHPDLQGKILPGYDFIGDVAEANDGDGRDPDASDPGDGVAAGECGPNAPAEPSSWHGTIISGIIAANTNNAVGMAGINWNARILPVRVLGKCGGYMSDVLDGARWAAGLRVAGVPDNPNPARVINLSLGAAGACGPAEQDAFNAIRAAGAIVIAAAGNDGADMDSTPYSPATCPNVITVGATDRNGQRTPYSNYGAAVSVSAPGGYFTGATDAENGVLSLYNSDSVTIDATTYCYAYTQGTSMSTAQVAGVVSLMLAVNPALTPDQTLQILGATARPINDGFCNTGAYCGKGLVDAAAALTAVAASQPADTPSSTQAPNTNTNPGAGGGGGGGGCSLRNGGRPDPVLLLLPLLVWLFRALPVRDQRGGVWR